ncbi:histidine kinase, partial [Pseudonocardia sp. KRD-184]
LNTIAALIRTDPLRARELLFGFADLSRTADGPPESTLGRELETVRAYLAIEQARFGARLGVTTEVEQGVEPVPVPTMAVLTMVRDAVQRGIEPRREGGVLALSVRRVDAGCEVTVTAAAGEPAVLVLPTG